MSGLRRKRSGNQSQLMKSLKKPNTGIDFTLDDQEYGDAREGSNSNADDIISSDDEDLKGGDESDMESSDEEETVDAKRIRMAREYLAKMEQTGDDSSSAPSSSDDEDEDDEMMDEDERMSKLLERKRLKQQGLYERAVANEVKVTNESWWSANKDSITTGAKEEAKLWIENDRIKLCRGHDLTPTCVALHAPSGSVAYSGSKDNSILMWDVETQRKLNSIVPKWNPKTCDFTRNSGEILAMSASDDGRFLAVGGRDATVKIYDVRQKTTKNKAVVTETITKNDDQYNIRGIVTTFEGHKGPVTALAFRSQSRQLFSGSDDRCIRHYNLDEMAYIETLYGHQSGVTGISCHGIRHELPFSSGRDRTVRGWKIDEETHMIYRGGAKISSADCISAIKDDYFLTGHDDGVLSLWMKDKKRPVAMVRNSHGKGASTLPRGITSCTSLGGSDFAATGSNDGYLRLWEVSTGAKPSERGLKSIGKIPLFGFINDIAIGPKARFCVAAVGQEPRLGRWDRVPQSKNRFAIVQLRDDNDNGENDDEAEEESSSVTQESDAVDDENEDSDES